MNKKGAACDGQLVWTVTGCFIKSGWTEFCTINKLQIGDVCKFKHLENVEKTTFKLCTREKKQEPLSTRFVRLTATPYSLEKGRHVGYRSLSLQFLQSIKVTKLWIFCSIYQKNSRKSMDSRPGRSFYWIKMDLPIRRCLLKARRTQGHKYLQIKDPIIWKKFCPANGVKAGESLTLELIARGKLRFFSKVSFELQITCIQRYVLVSDCLTLD